jgi:uncharacterized protein
VNTAIVIFAKAPLPGFAKTRLAPALGEVGAAALAQRMLEHTVQQAAQAGLGAVEICTTPSTPTRNETHNTQPSIHPSIHPIIEQAAQQHGASLTLQGEGDLGQRMHRALERVLAQNSQALLIGTDAPALDAPLLRRAAAALATHEVVFVPALDGGYALVGLRRADPRWFLGLTWSTPRVMQHSRERLQAAGVSWAELPPVADIDEPSDLVHLPTGWLQALDFANDKSY